MEEQVLTGLQAKVAEENELNTLLDRGFAFKAPKRSLLRFLGKPERTFTYKQPYLGTLDYLSREFIHIDFSLADFEGDSMAASQQLIIDHAKRASRICAMAYLNSPWKIKMLTGVLSWYFRWHLTPRTLFQLTMLIQKLSNLSDFIISIRLMSAKRTTTPALMENQPANQPD